MGWFGRNTEQQEAEAALMRGFHFAAMAAADSYEIAYNRVDEGDLSKLFTKLRASHLDFADDFRKRARKLGADVGEESELGKLSGRLLTRVQAAGSVRDLLIAMRQGEENGVAMCREALEETDLSGKSRSLLESQLRAHVDSIRDLSEQIALRGTLVGTQLSFMGPQWLRYPNPGFWVFQGVVWLLGFLTGRRRAA